MKKENLQILKSDLISRKNIILTFIDDAKEENNKKELNFWNNEYVEVSRILDKVSKELKEI